MKTLFVALIFILITTPAISASKQDIDKMTTYAVMLGRAAGCGFDTTYEFKQVGYWLDRTFPPKSKDQQIYLPIFLSGVEYHAQQQADGKSPDSCSSIKKSLAKTTWN